MAVARLPSFVDLARTHALPCPFPDDTERASSTSLYGTSAARPTPWWLWWNLLSLDAPTVAILWAVLFARTAPVHLSRFELSSLVFVVWLVYVLDRILDGWKATPLSLLRARHRFCKRYAKGLLMAALVSAAAVAWIAFSALKPQEIWNGIKVGCAIAAYMLCIHAWRGGLARYLPKELFVGTLFSIGTTLPIWSGSQPLSGLILLSWILFALLCVLNCMAIECWETPSGQSAEGFQQGLFVCCAAPHFCRITLILALFSVVPLLLYPNSCSPHPFLAIAASALALFLLHKKRNRLSPEALRVLADGALAVPPLLVLVFRP